MHVFFQLCQELQVWEHQSGESGRFLQSSEVLRDQPCYYIYEGLPVNQDVKTECKRKHSRKANFKTKIAHKTNIISAFKLRLLYRSRADNNLLVSGD